MLTKKCTSCKKDKGYGEFNKQANTKTGLSIYCRECSKAKQRDARKNNPEKFKSYDKDYYRNNKEEAKARTSEYKRTDRYKQSHKKYRYTNKEKLAARRAIERALLTKRLIKPTHCSYCGNAYSYEEIHAHHYIDYEASLEVVWLCEKCHSILEKKDIRVSQTIEIIEE